MYGRLSLFSWLCACLAAGAARADLEVALEGKNPPAPVESQASAPAPAPAAPRPAPTKPQPKPTAARSNPGKVVPLASRSVPRQVGVVRRGAPPVLPAIDGAADPQIPLAADQVEVSARLGKMLASTADVYRLPDPRSQWVGRVRQGQQVAIVSQWQGWFAIVMADGSQAYVPQTQVEVQPYQVRTVITSPTAPAAPAFVPRPKPQLPVVTPATFAAELAAAPTYAARAAIQNAFQYFGVRYVYGGNGYRGIDCSGLVKNCFAAAGQALPRRASHQARIGQPVPLDQLQPGDRLYFSVTKALDHTAIYLGNGYFIHAARSRGKVTIDHLSIPMYGKHLVSARRS